MPLLVVDLIEMLEDKHRFSLGEFDVSRSSMFLESFLVVILVILVGF